MRYARICCSCNRGMNEGYVIESGIEYYCSDECLQRHYSPQQWAEMYTEDGDSYYTEWDDEDDYEYFEVDLGFASFVFEIESDYFWRSFLIGKTWYNIHYSLESNSVRVYEGDNLIKSIHNEAISI